jgi:hypothetical protein
MERTRIMGGDNLKRRGVLLDSTVNGYGKWPFIIWSWRFGEKPMDVWRTHNLKCFPD